MRAMMLGLAFELASCATEADPGPTVHRSLRLALDEIRLRDKAVLGAQFSADERHSHLEQERNGAPLERGHRATGAQARPAA